MDGERDTGIDKQKIKIPYSFSHPANIDCLFCARHFAVRSGQSKGC